MDCEDPDEAEHDDEDGSFSWLKEMGVQDKIKKPDSISIQLYPCTDILCVPHTAKCHSEMLLDLFV